ncbi:MAG: hypothetical protein E6Y91_01620, partial [Peptostreptococcus anaerobius]|nr:hypothetical protein [Peptostreptococcus sp.]MDU5986459.1 hypothetical protein [Peptostreptococcus anaerobius]
TVITLQVAMRFVGNYALRGLSPQTDGMPVILKKGPWLGVLQTNLYQILVLVHPVTLVRN